VYPHFAFAGCTPTKASSGVPESPPGLPPNPHPRQCPMRKESCCRSPCSGASGLCHANTARFPRWHRFRQAPSCSFAFRAISRWPANRHGRIRAMMRQADSHFAGNTLSAPQHRNPPHKFQTLIPAAFQKQLWRKRPDSIGFIARPNTLVAASSNLQHSPPQNIAAFKRRHGMYPSLVNRYAHAGLNAAVKYPELHIGIPPIASIKSRRELARDKMFLFPFL